MIQRHRVLALYKRVLKCNAMLVPDMRQLGDVYTKVEFRYSLFISLREFIFVKIGSTKMQIHNLSKSSLINGQCTATILKRALLEKELLKIN